MPEPVELGDQAVSATVDPWAFHGHVVSLGVLAGVSVVWAAAALRFGPPSGRQWRLGAAAVVATAICVAWPLADLAAHWSLLALVVQRLLLMLVVAPLVLTATPERLLERLTRPAVVDRTVETVTHPAAAVAAVSVLSVVTLLPGAVAAQASSPAARGALDAVMVVTGFILWAPVLRVLPGTARPSPVGTAVYLVVQSLVPTFLAVVYVFARHPFYTVYADAHGAIGLSPVGDQEVAGIVGKMGTLPVLWTVAYREVTRGRRAHDAGVDPNPLRWADVERNLQRAARHQRRAHQPGGGHPRRAPRQSWRPQLSTRFPTVEPLGPEPPSPPGGEPPT